MALDYYMKKFREIYPTGPKIMEVFQLYQTALQGVNELDLDMACERALKECRFFPTPAEILGFCPKNDFISTATHYDEPPMSEEDKQAVITELEALKQKLGVKPKIVREKSTVPYQRSETNYIAMVGSQTLQQWALDQDLNDTLPRTPQEIELIRTVKNYGKPKKKKRLL